MYQNVFKQSCRVCHISRQGTSFQFASYADFSAAGFGQPSACNTLEMPHAQRTWGVFWGSRASSRTGNAVDQPSFLHTISAAAGTCP